MDIHQEVDARGLNCPLPILKAKKALAQMQTGQVLKVVADKILYTETWLWKQGFSAEQKWLR